MRSSGRIWAAALAAAAGLAAGAAPLSAQFRPAEIAQRESWEEFLRTAEIIKSEPEREGVTHPWKLTLRQGDVEHKAVWKDIDAVDGEIPDRWRFEVAAYRLDKLLDLNMVPPVVEREFRGKKGDLSLWADNKYSELKVEEENILKPESVLAHWNDMKYLTRAWDCLIANDDRTQQNVLYTDDWRTILIDHTRAFRSDKAHRERLIYGAKGLKTMDDGRGGRAPGPVPPPAPGLRGENPLPGKGRRPGRGRAVFDRSGDRCLDGPEADPVGRNRRDDPARRRKRRFILAMRGRRT